MGSSLNLGRRLRNYYSVIFISHISRKNMVINKALLKYGYSNFKLEILEYCNSKELVKREQHYIDLLSPDYNVLKTAYSSLGYKHTEDSLAKMRNFVLSDEVRKRKASSTANASAANRVPI